MSPVELILSRLPHHKRNGQGWTARCPAHNDKHPSLSVKEGDDGKALLFCHAGCSAKAIVAAMGLKMADLMNPDTKQKRPTVAKPKAAKKESVMTLYATAKEVVAELCRRKGELSARWTYHNADGEPVGLVLRWNRPDGSKDIQPISRRPGGWANKAMLEPRPLYRLLDLLARPDETTFVAEGEKCADTMNGLGLLATTSAGGSGAANKSDWTPLAGRDVVLLPDNDDVGQKYAHAVEPDRVPLAEVMKPAKGKRGKAVSAALDRRPSGLDAAHQVLTEAGEPMRCGDVVDKMLADGIWKTSGRTPSATIYAATVREIAIKGVESRFKKTDRGLFTVNAN